MKFLEKLGIARARGPAWLLIILISIGLIPIGGGLYFLFEPQEWRTEKNRYDHCIKFKLSDEVAERCAKDEAFFNEQIKEYAVKVLSEVHAKYDLEIYPRLKNLNSLQTEVWQADGYSRPHRNDIPKLGGLFGVETLEEAKAINGVGMPFEIMLVIGSRYSEKNIFEGLEANIGQRREGFGFPIMTDNLAPEVRYALRKNCHPYLGCIALARGKFVPIYDGISWPLGFLTTALKFIPYSDADQYEMPESTQKTQKR